jgi:hypothetical protein
VLFAILLTARCRVVFFYFFLFLFLLFLFLSLSFTLLFSYSLIFYSLLDMTEVIYESCICFPSDATSRHRSHSGFQRVKAVRSKRVRGSSKPWKRETGIRRDRRDEVLLLLNSLRSRMLACMRVCRVQAPRNGHTDR